MIKNQKSGCCFSLYQKVKKKYLLEPILDYIQGIKFTINNKYSVQLYEMTQNDGLKGITHFRFTGTRNKK